MIEARGEKIGGKRKETEKKRGRQKNSPKIAKKRETAKLPKNESQKQVRKRPNVRGK